MSLASEDQVLALIDRHFPNAHECMVLGRGDDCAILHTARRWCVSTDLFLEDVHFRTGYFSPADIGSKALARALSDLAAMGAKPLAFTLDLMLPASTSESFLAPLLAAMATLAAECGCVLAGGDVSRTDKLGLGLTVFGQAGPSGRLLNRGGGRPGDSLFVCGDLGLARVGLLGFEAEGVRFQAHPLAVAAHLRPSPLLAEGLILAGLGGVHGLMDVSDGLARDLPRFLGPLGADLRIHEDELHPEVQLYASRLNQDPALFAVLGGEDYALLGVASQADMAAVAAACPGVTPIGSVRADPGLVLNGRPLTAHGFDHFEDA